MFGGVFHDYLYGPWEEVRGYLVEELEQLQNVLSSQWARVFNTEGTLTPDAIEGDYSSGVVYVSNEGAGGTPKWAKVNVATGVKGRLGLANFTQATGGNRLLGRDVGAGNYEEIITGDALDVASATLDVKVDGVTITINGSNQLVAAAGTGGSWIPLSTGTEPLTFISDGAGNPILVAYP